jgi:hypothetical protein
MNGAPRGKEVRSDVLLVPYHKEQVGGPPPAVPWGAGACARPCRPVVPERDRLLYGTLVFLRKNCNDGKRPQSTGKRCCDGDAPDFFPGQHGLSAVEQVHLTRTTTAAGLTEAGPSCRTNLWHG